MVRLLIICTILLTVSFRSHAQETFSQCKWISTFNKHFSLDSLSIIPGTVKIHHKDSASFIVNFDEQTGAVSLKTERPVDSVLVCYQSLPFDLRERYYHRSLEAYDSNAYFKDPVKAHDPVLLREELFAIEGLNKSGSISRGISFGNNQDVFVQSTLNLNMEGKLADNLNIRAAITDQNVPFEPEGNTQQLRDFDNVFIELFNDNFSVIGGDVVLKNRPSYFLKYNKNVQGALAQVKYNIADSINAVSSFGISVAKGRFASVQIPPMEGVLGPYRIPGPENERYILILANSEKVFLDGEPLIRGFNNDYVIDYNSAEITFTNRVLITEFSRIRIDYEYADRNYSRTIAAASHHQQMGQLELFVNAYSEKDNKNRPLLVDLTNEDKLLLSTIGDDLDKAVISGADSAGYSKHFILYKKEEITTQDGIVHTIFTYSNEPDSAVYKVSFSKVGLNNGNYVQAQTTVNGSVYEWVAPLNGIPQGDYEPVLKIPAPNKKQLVNVGGRFKVNQHENIYAEIALSDQDENLFSTLDKGNNRGFAMKVGIASEGRVLRRLQDYKWKLFSDLEINDRYFKPIDRFRGIEYDRDWGNSESTSEMFNDKILNAGVSFRKDAENGLDYNLSYRKKGYQVNGFQHKLAMDKRLGKFQLRTSLFNLNNDQDSVRSTWIRYGTDISYQAGWMVPGYVYQIDRNMVESHFDNAVIHSAMYFDQHSFYLKNSKKSPFDFELRHSMREDMKPSNGEMLDYTRANTTQFSFSKDHGDQRVGAVFSYRKIDNLQKLKNEETISGRFDWQSKWFNNHIRSDLTYAISNSRELKREYVFITVPTGQGTHTWRDLNEDGIQQLNEFFEALNPDERNYAKIFVPTNDFVTAFKNLLIYRITLEMPRSWSTQQGLKKFLSRFSNNTSWSADVKTTDKAMESRLLGFARNIDETLLLAEKNVLRSTWFYNRASARYGLEAGYFNSRRKQLLSGGFDSRNTEEFTVSFRLNFLRTYSFKVRSSKALKQVGSDFLDGRNYKIGSQRISPEISWQPTRNMRLSGQYGHERKSNVLTPESDESASADEFGMNLKLNRAIKSSFNASLRWVEIAFNGKENTPIGYDLLNALKPGTNITWGVNWQQKIASGLQLNLSYDGRKSEHANAVHVGRVQVSALF